MNTINYNLISAKNGGNITSFSYSHRLNELSGTWTAQVAGGYFTAGEAISFDNVLNNGIISKAQKDSSGLWHIEGYDAGVRLMRSTPDIEDLPEGNAKTVIQFLADFCGITLNMTGEGLSDFNVRSLISGSTCAEAVLELAMFSGYIAFIGNDGSLVLQPPAQHEIPLFDNIIDDSGSDFDLDGYATQVTVILRKSSIQEDEPSGGHEYYTGKTPSTSPDKKTYTGSFSNGGYSFTMLEPFGVISKLKTTITENDVTIQTEEEHDYDYKHQTIWRDNQEYVLFAFIETEYSLTKTVTGTYNSNITFSEVTTETMNRSLSRFDAIGVPEDWSGRLDMVDSETITRSTVRTGAPEPTADMPPYAPPFDSQITRTYSRGLRGKSLVCNETEKRYEARQVGLLSPVTVDGKPVPHFLSGSNLAIQTHSAPQWVEVNTYRTYFEQYDNDGNCILSTRSEYSDDGSKWLTEHSLADTGDAELNEYQKAYAKFSQTSQGLEVSLGSSVLSSAWHFVELQGRTKNTTGDDENGTALGNVDEWYNNGAYIPSEICPHYNEYTRTCNVVRYEQSQEENCVQGSRGMYSPRWLGCQRALRMLDLAKQKEEKQIDAPFIGTAALSDSFQQSPTVGYKREIYIDDDISDEQAQTIADTIAANILSVKGTKGLRQTVTIPYNHNLELDGLVVEISHDWENLTSSVTYRKNGNIPEFLVAQSVSGIATFVSARENSKLSVPKYGVVSALDDKFITVNTDNHSVACTTKLKNLSIGDNVLVSFPSGNKFRGQVIARL